MERKPNYDGLPTSLQTFGLLFIFFSLIWFCRKGDDEKAFPEDLVLFVFFPSFFEFWGVFLDYLFVFFITEMKPEFTFIIIPFPFHLKVWYVCC